MQNPIIKIIGMFIYKATGLQCAIARLASELLRAKTEWLMQNLATLSSRNK
jgi:hypothetical protein